jgi:uncharacterized protein (UPF0261 family)
MSTIAILGAFDTKGEEHGFVADLVRARGHQPFLIDCGILETPKIRPDISGETVAAAAGANLAEMRQRRDRGSAVDAMARGAALVVPRLAAEGKIDGIISLGGGGGTAIATAAMRALPLGFPKLMVTTVATGNTGGYLGVKDIVLFPSVVDVAGLNRISRVIFTRAAGAICGMVEAKPALEREKPVIVASMFGNTTPCVERARKILEDAGFEVLVFHATGTGGKTMESLVEAGFAVGVLDITTTEWADELAGGFLTAGPTRLEAAAKSGTPAIIAPGCLDMVNFFEPPSIPAKYAGRVFYRHNPQVTLMRVSVEESARLGQILAEKINMSVGPVTVLLPTRGLSVIGAPGGPFHDPVADAALARELKMGLRADIPVNEMDVAINDPAFAEACARALLANIQSGIK